MSQAKSKRGGARPGAGRPRVSDEIKKLRGTFRPDRAHTPVMMPQSVEASGEASEFFHVVGDTFWFGNPKVRYALIDGRPWREGDPPYDSFRFEDGAIVYDYREGAR